MMQLMTLWPWIAIAAVLALLAAWRIRKRRREAQLAEDLAAISERRRQQKPVAVDQRTPQPRELPPNEGGHG